MHTSASFSHPLRDACSVRMPGIYTQTNRLQNLTNNVHKRKADRHGGLQTRGVDKYVVDVKRPQQTNPAPILLHSQVTQRSHGMCFTCCLTHTHASFAIIQLLKSLMEYSTLSINKIKFLGHLNLD